MSAEKCKRGSQYSLSSGSVKMPWALCVCFVLFFWGGGRGRSPPFFSIITQTKKAKHATHDLLAEHPLGVPLVLQGHKHQVQIGAGGPRAHPRLGLPPREGGEEAVGGAGREEDEEGGFGPCFRLWGGGWRVSGV